MPAPPGPSKRIGGEGLRRALWRSLGISFGLLLAAITALWWVRPRPDEFAGRSAVNNPAALRPSPAQDVSGWAVTGLILRRGRDGSAAPAPGVSVRVSREPE